MRGTGGEHTPIGADGTIDLSPSNRLFITEAEIITKLYNGIKLLLEKEAAAGLSGGGGGGGGGGGAAGASSTSAAGDEASSKMIEVLKAQATKALGQSSAACHASLVNRAIIDS